MKNKKPYNLNKIITVYNAFQIFACLAIIYGVSPKLTDKTIQQTNKQTNDDIRFRCFHHFLSHVSDANPSIIRIRKIRIESPGGRGGQHY